MLSGLWQLTELELEPRLANVVYYSVVTYLGVRSYEPRISPEGADMRIKAAPPDIHPGGGALGLSANDTR